MKTPRCKNCGGHGHYSIGCYKLKPTIKPIARVRVCKNCSQEFVVYTSLQKACSVTCFIEWTQSKPPKKIKRSSTRINRIRRLYSGKCSLDGITKEHNYNHQLEGHHIIYLSQQGPDQDWNIIPLCRICHKLVHRDKGYWQKRLIIRRGGTDWFNNIPKIADYDLMPELMRPQWLKIAKKLNNAQEIPASL